MSILPRRFLIVLLTLYTFLVVYVSQRSEILQDFTHTSATVKSQISQQVQLSNGFIDQMSLLGGEFFINNGKTRSPLNKFLLENPSGKMFSMDTVKNSAYTGSAGNLTGSGHLGEDFGKTENINLALLYNAHFKYFYDSLPGITWVYYTGKEGFVMMYPWISSKDFSFSPDLFNLPFYTIVLPENNPSRVRQWTPPYLDSAGKGLMVTLSAPVYKEDTMRGVISVDITLHTLSSMMNPRFHSFMVNGADQVLASNGSPSSITDKIPTLEEYVGREQAQALSILKNSGDNPLKTFKGRYIYVAAVDNSPWTFYSELSYWEVFLKCSFSGAPVLLIGLLLLLSSNANDRRKKAEHVLKGAVLELEESRRQLHAVASIDFLTGALNRRRMTERLYEEVSRFERYGSPFSLILGDIDHFKDFNDNYGHAAGDVALKHIVSTIVTNIRGSDLLCRWGGEEFLIMLPDTGYEEAILVAEKLKTSIGNSCFLYDDMEDIQITMSFGVSEYTHEKNLDHNIIQADDALYQAKNTGRNRVIGFNDIQRAP